MSVTLGVSLTTVGRSVAATHGAGDGRGHVGVLTKVGATGVAVRAGDIDFEGGNTGHTVEQRGQTGEVSYRLPGDIDQHRHRPGCPLRRVLLDDRLDTHVLQADRVEHPGRRLDRARRWIAHTWLQRGAFADDGAEALDVHQPGELDAVAECAARGQDGVPEHQARRVRRGQVDRQVGRDCARAPKPGRRPRSARQCAVTHSPSPRREHGVVTSRAGTGFLLPH